MTRLILPLSAVVLIGVCVHARAEPARPLYPFSFTCDQVRSFVAVHGRWRAEALAIAAGATAEQKRAARRCLNEAKEKPRAG